jgi:hypothetical protein
MRSKLLIAGLVVVAIIAIGVGVALFAARTSPAPTNPTTVTENSNPQTTPEPTHTSTQPHESNPAPITPPVVTQAMPIITPAHLANATNAASTNEWEEKIDEIVGSDDPDTNKIAQLYALFPKLPPDGQEEAAQHLSNLVDDEDYAPLGEMLKNDKLPEGVLDELLADVLNRPNNLKLPLLLAVASDANHAKHDEAKDLLELYLGEDYGSDWNSWGQHMTNWLQQNPE